MLLLSFNMLTYDPSPRGRALDMVMNLPEHDHSIKYLKARLAVCK